MFNFIARSLRIKLLLIFVIMLLAFSSVHLVIREYWTIPQLVALEVEKDKKDIYKLNSALLRVYNELEMLVYDNAVWDELYNVILTRDLDYLETNFFIPKSFVSLKINGMSFFDQNNNPLSSSPFKSLPPSLKKNLLISKQEMINNGQQTLFKQGLITLNDRLILFVSGSVLPSSGVGDLAGTMLVWSYFDGKIAHQLSEITQTTVTAAQADTFSATTPIIDFNQLDAQNHIRTQLSNIHVRFNDIFNEPALILSYPTPRRMFDDSPFEMSMVVALLMSLVILLIIYFILTIMIIEPLNKLKATVREVMERGNFQLTTNLERTDEIGRLALLIDVLFNKVHVQQHALKHNNRQLKRLSDTDPLTGIANRRAMMQVLEQLTPSAMPISVIMLDVDYFKKFNDCYGHQQGDLALKHVAKALKHHIRRQNDVIARYGGEEFVVVLLNTCQSDARSMAYAIREAIEGLAIEHKTSLISQFLTASIGVSCCDEFDNFSIETLLHQADSALYKAKEQGRNCVVDYNSEMHKHAV